ncbi:MAG: 1-acyl-sn-glycerol-3-phosphate acyltransferase [Desulfosarcina sp.]|nr:1-acyl-sn-glycerol-3-phosphate acyltransferase [Desulfosarcina sp.]MBC2765933.1 1-acyl-sn-glycerol-3-phosphate acyltransferase [Desulfosarcina sp.]
METTLRRNWYHTLIDLVITLILWGYYTIGFVILFSPIYLFTRLFSADVTLAFQRLNTRFYRWFFMLLRFLVPACQWQVDEAVKTIRGAVIVANHVSYLDPILLISFFSRHTTIAKRRLFHIPIYGRMLRLSGYIPSATNGQLVGIMLSRMEEMPAFLTGGGNLFVFPEGTRSRDGGIGPLNKGPIHVVYMENTDRLFRPGRFLFDTRATNTVRVEHLTRIEPEYDDPGFSLKDLMGQVRGMLEARRLQEI